ncbi:alkaline phosphatase [Corynebacterium doosanense]|uniref:Alkaline phosphatase n=1 Tax=Corynebacterium doosanense CAU 212 = DSM 45436 TaxID=558173 RepID=A0A097IFU3_9CORY|nr:alkaline phosphatase [Corynebacterium doosanense CAU 212 = DSM 45436]
MAVSSSRSSSRRIIATVATAATVCLAATACNANGEGSSTSSATSTVTSAADGSSSATAASGNQGSPVSRDAAGNLSEHGGARRLDGDQKDSLQAAIEATGAKNVILLIGDGMGDSEITLARNYAEGAGGAFDGIDSLPVTGQYTHYALDKEGKPDYVTDSAASGTAWATGTKTYNNAVSVDIHGAPQATLLQIAKANGKATGNVSTSEIQDATPAVQASHVTLRKCYGPEETTKSCPDNALENGGEGSISEQILTTRADVTLGGGMETFGEKATAGDYEGKTLLDQAKERGYQVPTTSEELEAITEANEDAPVLGLFSEGNMPVRWDGPKASKQGYLAEPITCADNPKRTAEVPVLADMTTKAIDLLKGDEDGFFLQVEGASIDKQNHSANPCGQIGETVDLDEAVQAALEFAEKDGETLVVVTADHAHTSQILGGVDEEDLAKIAEEKELPVEQVRDIVYPGLSARLNTTDGAVMTVGYATSEDPEVESEGHTGSQLRIAAYGPSAANVAGLSDQTDLFFTVVEALGLDTSRYEVAK